MTARKDRRDITAKKPVEAGRYLSGAADKLFFEKLF
jgi:hypothetical protein